MRFAGVLAVFQIARILNNKETKTQRRKAARRKSWRDTNFTNSHKLASRTGVGTAKADDRQQRRNDTKWKLLEAGGCFACELYARLNEATNMRLCGTDPFIYGVSANCVGVYHNLVSPPSFGSNSSRTKPPIACKTSSMVLPQCRMNLSESENIHGLPPEVAAEIQSAGHPSVSIRFAKRSRSSTGHSNP